MQETAVNAVNTTSATVAAVSTVLLFTPLAAFGAVGLIGSGVAGAATGVGDAIANSVKSDKIKEISKANEGLMKDVEAKLVEMDKLINKVADVGKIPITTARQVTFGFVQLAKSAAYGRMFAAGDKIPRLMGLFRVWRAGQLAPGGTAAIRTVAGAGSRAFAFLGSVVSIWIAVDGWVNGNPTKNATIEMKGKFQESEKALKQMIDMLEGKLSEG